MTENVVLAILTGFVALFCTLIGLVWSTSAKIARLETTIAAQTEDLDEMKNDMRQMRDQLNKIYLHAPRAT